jgi:hypothetical protein
MKKSIAVLDEITDELRNVSVFLDFEKVLTEQTEEISRHQLCLLEGTRPAIHHSQVLYVV